MTRPTTLFHRIFYGIGYIGVLVPGVVFGSFVTYFYIQHIKLDPALVGVGFGIINGWEAFVAPFIGYISDRTRTRWGRRLPYIVIGIPVLAVLLNFIFNPPLNNGIPWLLPVFFFGSILLADSVFMTCDINWQAINPEMNVDLKSRAQQGAIVGIISLLMVAVVSSTMLPLASKIGWGTAVRIIAIIAVVFGFLGLLGLKENPAFAKKQALSLKAAILQTVKNKASRMYLGIGIIDKIVFFATTTMIPLFTVWILRVNEEQAGYLLMASIGGMALLFPAAAFIVNKIGPRISLMVSLAVILLPMICLLLPFTNFTWMLIIFGFSSIGYALIAISENIMLTDLIDADALEVGRRREGMYTSAYAFVQRIGAFIFSAAMGIALKASGFNAVLSAQPATALISIRSLIAGVPILCCLIGLFLLSKYPIKDHQAKEIRDKAQAQRLAFIDEDGGAGRSETVIGEPISGA